MNKQLRINNFLEKIKILGFDEFYDYTNMEYINNRTPIQIRCKKHDNYFFQRPEDHLRGHISCEYCSSNKKMTKETFIIKAKEVHGDKYDYSLVDYKNNKTKVKIICNTHNIFEMRPDAHLQGSECDCCRKEYGLKFLENAKIKHGDIYDYSLVNYINYYTKVKIVCIEHDVFEQTPGNHLRGFGCPLCFKSRGENLLFGLFKKYNIEFETQKTFNGCKNIRCLLFDFYLPMYNICIEFDGRQHFESIEYWGGDEKLIYTKNNDKIKTKYCLENNIILIRIKYDITFKNMEEIVENIIKNK